MVELARRNGVAVVPTEEKVGKVFAHPLRVKCWQLIHQNPDSPVELAKKLDEPLGNVAYHCRVLEKYGCIEVAETHQRRGATEHVYRSTQRPEVSTDEWEQLSQEDREDLSLYWFQLIVGEVVAAMGAGNRTFDSRVERHASRVPLELDEEGWAKVAGACEDFKTLMVELARESTERVAANPGTPTIPAVSTLMFFERAPLPAGVSEVIDPAAVS